MEAANTAMNDDSQGAVEQGKEQVQEKASQLGDRIQQTARDQIDQRSTDAGKRVQALSSDLRSVGERLREDGNERSGESGRSGGRPGRPLWRLLERLGCEHDS